MRPMHPVPIAFAFDRRFASYCVVAALSIVLNSASRHRFILFFDEMTQDIFEKFQSIARKFDCEFVLKAVDLSISEGWKGNAHIPNSAYYRFSLFQDNSIDRCLYVDSDTLTTIDVTPLLESDLKDCALAAVNDHRASQTVRVPMSSRDKYFNSGVMLLDLKQLREMDLIARFSSTYQEHHHLIEYADQCVINHVIDGLHFPLDNKWNRLFSDVTTPEQQVMFTASGDRSLLHYSGGCKPWMDWCSDMISAYWLSYARLAGFDKPQVMISPRTACEYIAMAEKYELSGDLKSSLRFKNIVLTHFMTKN